MRNISVKNINILLVDDDEINLLILNEYLKKQYNIFLAENAQDALRILDKSDIHLILLDVEMPEIDGFELASIIKSNPKTDNIPFMFLTGREDDESIEKGLELGAKDFISKPFKQKQLKLKIENQLTTYFQKKKIEEDSQTIISIQNLVNDYLIYSETDLSGTITYSSKSFCELSGFTQKELVGKKHSIVRHPDMSDEIFKDMWDTIKNKQIWQGEVKNLTKDGHYYWVYANVFAKYDKNGNHIGYISLRQDITAKKEAETQLNRINEENRIRSLKDLLLDISHHWRQPLSVITSISSGVQIEQQFEVLDIQSLDEKMQEITNNAQYLSDTIEDFNSYVNSKDELEKFYIKSQLNSILSMMESELDGNFIKVIKKYQDKEDFSINSFKKGFIQICMSILQNAKDALIDLKSLNNSIEVDYEIINNKLILTIEDNAGGIEENIIGKIFDPYFSTKHKSQGRGLSLFNAKKITEEIIDGEIYVKNTNTGAKFFIEIPI